MSPSPTFQYPRYQMSPRTPLNSNVDLNTNDPNKLFRGAQNVAFNQGSSIDSDLSQQGQQYGNLWGQYGDTMNSAYGQLNQNPGYTDQQSANITRDPQYQGLATTADQYAQLGPTGSESAGMMGDTGSYSRYYNPDAINGTTQQMADVMRGNVAKTENTNSDVLGQQRKRLNSAIDPSQLNISGDYVNNNSAVLNGVDDRLSSAQGTASKSLNSAASNPNLGITGEYGRQAGMTDQEVQDTANAGARDVGLRYQAMEGDAARRAAAGGNTSALAVGAQQARLGQQAATESADARTNAQLAARQAQRGAATGVEQTRLGAQQYQTGAQMNAGQYLGSQASQNAQYEGGLAQSAVQNQENTRLGAAQYLTGQQVNAANQVAGNQLQANEYTGNQGMQAESAIGGQGLAGQEYNQSTGTNIAMSQDQANAARSSQAYGIRQGNQQYQQQNTYNQGMGINNALSNNYGKVADKSIAGQQEYRNWTTGQTGQYLGAQQQNNQQRISNYGTMTGAMNNNANAWGNYSLGADQNSFGGTLKRGLANGIAKAATGQTKFGGG